MKQKNQTALALALLLALPLSVQAASISSQADVTWNGNRLDAKALVTDGNLSLPLRSVSTALGYQVTWSQQKDTQQVAVTQGSDKVVFDLTAQRIDDNGHTYYDGTENGDALTLVGGITYADADLLADVFGVDTAYDAASGTAALTPLVKNSVTLTNVSQSLGQTYLDAQIQYPQLFGLTSAAAQDSINTAIKQLADASLAQGKANAAYMAGDVAAGYGAGSGICATDFNYIVKYNQNGLLSIVFSDYQYAGGAHGLTARIAKTFDLSTGKELALSELMDSAHDYTAYVDTAIRREIDARVASGELYEFSDSPFKTIGATPEYYLTNHAIVFYFQQYDHFPYAAGIQSFAIPYTDIAGLLRSSVPFFTQPPVTLTEKAVNTLTVGQIGQITLAGNPTTGYTWHVENSDPSVMMPVGVAYQSSSSGNVVGAGGTYVWRFKALRAGEATLILRYYRDWDGVSSAAQTLTYRVTVS